MKKTTSKSCHTSCEEGKHNTHPDHHKQLNRLNRTLGQLNGIKIMIERRDYCPNILTQIKAARSALKSLEASILERHIESCVRDALSSKDKNDIEAKIKELTNIFKKSDS